MAGSKRGFGDLNVRAEAATKGVNALTHAFGDLSKKGEVSAASINQLAGSLAMVNPVLGLITAAVGATVASFKMIEELDAKEALEGFGVGANVAALEFQRFAAVTVVGAGSSDRLMEAQKRLADSQFSLKEKASLLNIEIARQAALVKEHPELEANAAAAVEDYKNKLKEQFKARADIVDAIQIEIEHIKGDEAATKRNQKAQDDYNETLEREIDLFNLTQRGRAQAGGLRGQQIEEIERHIALAEQLYEVELKTSTGDPAATLKRISDLKDYSAELEFQISVQERLGAMAESAIAGAGAAAFDQYGAAMERVVDGNNAFNKSSGRAMQNALSATLKQVGQRAAIEATMETAYGVAALTPYGAAIYGPPGQHFAAAAMFASVAAITGASGAALSVKSGGGGGGGGSGRGNAGGGKTLNLSLTVVGTLDTQSRKDLFSQLAQEFQEAG